MLLVALFLFPSPIAAQDCNIGVKSADSKAYNQAIGLFNDCRFKESAQAMRRVASRNPKAADPQFWLGLTAAKDGFNTTAIRRYFGRCIELCPDYPNPLAHYYMGMILYTDGRYDDAAAELERYFSLAEGSNDRSINSVYEEASNYLHWSRFLAEAMLNQAPFDPHRLIGVSSTKNDEILPYMTLDGSTFYYLRQVPEQRTPNTFYHSDIERKQWVLCCSSWQDTSYNRGTPLPPPFNAGDPEGGVSITADGNELYYSIIRNNQGYANSDIYCVRRVDGRWQEPEALGPQVNNPDSWESQPTVSPDGGLLLFASNRKGGHGGIDIWRCRRLPGGDWSRAENLGDVVNTMGNEKFPFLAADGRTLYFLSDGWQGFGGFDVYFSNLADPYGNRPINLGLPINSDVDELSFGVTADGRRAYSSGRLPDSRSTDILIFDLYPNARPEPMRLCRMQACDSLGRPLDAVVKLAAGSQFRAGQEGAISLMLSEQYDNILTFCAEGFLPCVVRLRAADVARGRVGEGVTLLPLSSGLVQRMDLADEALLSALAQWLIDNPRVRIAVECPKKADAEKAYNALKQNNIRNDRLIFRGGTDIKHPQIRVL